MSNQSQFFIAGGTLAASAPSYVVRPADGMLLDSLRDHSFCYVLTARQMGKSSLMIRTASQLRRDGVQIALIDLSSIGVADAEAWYPSLLAVIQRQLQLQVNAAKWWREQHGLSPSQLFVNFMRDVLLTERSGDVVIFIDEIDTMLRLDFRDDFFAAIRAIYNARASEPIFKRLTFVLLGVATPLDLIRDPRLTPFNIGRRIGLQEFTYEELDPLREGLEARLPGHGQRILQRIYRWTNGHPYLTQKLCLAVEQSTRREWTDTLVDQLVSELFLGISGASDANLNFVRNSLANSPPAEREQMGQIYQAAHRGNVVPQDESSPAQNHLELFGLVRVQGGRLVVRNEIYKRVFKPEGMGSLGISASPPPPRHQNIVVWTSVVIVVVLVLLFGRQYASAAVAAVASIFNQRTPTPTANIPTATLIVTNTPNITKMPIPTNTSTATPALTDTPTMNPTPTDTPTIAPTPCCATPTTISTPTATEVIAICTVQKEVSIHSGPNAASQTIGSLKPSYKFTPVGVSGFRSRESVLVPGSSSGRPIGWVYAGTDLKLVVCTHLELVK